MPPNSAQLKNMTIVNMTVAIHDFKGKRNMPPFLHFLKSDLCALCTVTVEFLCI
jgi:hypothetical protein